MTQEGWAYIRTAEFKSVKDAVVAVFTYEAERGFGPLGSTSPEEIEALKALIPEERKIRGKFYYGPVSGALSRLAKEGKLVRLVEKRKGHCVYVLPEHVNGRPAHVPQEPAAVPESTQSLTEPTEPGESYYHVYWVTVGGPGVFGGRTYIGKTEADERVAEIEKACSADPQVTQVEITVTRTTKQISKRTINYGQEVSS